MSREERQALLHGGVSVMTAQPAYVEIVFDNSYSRSPTGREEVNIRRTIGLKKDECSIDKKSAGLSKSNPYYIVSQGRITALTNARDHERLTLLEEVAETKVYEQRRAESLHVIEKTDAKRTQINELLEYIEPRLAELEEERGELREFWREDSKLGGLKSAERSLAAMMNKDTGSGLRAVDRIAQRHNLEGVYDPSYRLFEILDPTFSTAIALTAGRFHMAVDMDEMASKVLKIMSKEKTGCITFMPLNCLKPKPLTSVPPAQDAFPLIDMIRFDATHQKAFQQVFGKTWVCRDLAVAAAYVKSHGVNTITLDGDKVDRKSGLTGEFHDVRRSRVEAIKVVASWRTNSTPATSAPRK